MINILESDTGLSTFHKETKVNFAKFDISIEDEASAERSNDENSFDKNDSDTEYTKGNGGEGQFCPPDDLEALNGIIKQFKNFLEMTVSMS